MQVPFYRLNRWYDRLEKTAPTTRFLLFLLLVAWPGVLIPFGGNLYNRVNLANLILVTLIRVPYAWKYL